MTKIIILYNHVPTTVVRLLVSIQRDLSKTFKSFPDLSKTFKSFPDVSKTFQRPFQCLSLSFQFPTKVSRQSPMTMGMSSKSIPSESLSFRHIIIIATETHPMSCLSGMVRKYISR